MMMTMRSHDQFNTTIYGMHDRYRGVYNERRVVFMNPKDMEKNQFQKLDLIDLESEYDGIKRKAEKFYVVPYKIPRQNLAAYFPEMNVLVPINHFADQSNTPISKSIIVSVKKHISS
jgi:anaerobic selenocysteine-containing dehydrogenase